MPLDHITITVPLSDFSAVVSFYTATLAPLGYETIVAAEGLVGLGYGGRPDFWISQTDRPKTTCGTHIAFSGDSHDVVKLCHEAALKTGARCNGPPGLRVHYRPTYYSAFMLDPVGNNVEVVCGNRDPEDLGTANHQ